jgi:hypothetical protein
MRGSAEISGELQISGIIVRVDVDILKE